MVTQIEGLKREESCYCLSMPPQELKFSQCTLIRLPGLSTLDPKVENCAVARLVHLGNSGLAGMKIRYIFDNIRLSSYFYITAVDRSVG